MRIQPCLSSDAAVNLEGKAVEARVHRDDFFVALHDFNQRQLVLVERPDIFVLFQ